MATSENGWTVIESSSDPRLAAFPWVTGKVLAGDVFTVLEYVARRFNSEVEGINIGVSWGYSYRKIANSTQWSNHASGTAIDLNPSSHPQGSSGTFTSGQRASIDSILAATSPVIRWGGGAAYSVKDEMHFEINEGISLAAVAQLAASLSGTTAPTEPEPTPDPESEEDDIMTMIYRAQGAAGYIFDGWSYLQGEDGVLRPLSAQEWAAFAQVNPRAAERIAVWSAADLLTLARRCGIYEFVGTAAEGPRGLTGRVIGRNAPETGTEPKDGNDNRRYL